MSKKPTSNAQLNERVASLEAKEDALEDRVDGFETRCKESMQGVARSLEKITNEEMHKFEERINESLDKKLKTFSGIKREPLGRKEWATIILAVINGLVAIIIAWLK